MVGSVTVKAPERADDDVELTAARSQLQREPEVPKNQRLKTVLLIEDDRELAIALAERLQRAGLVVAKAHDGPSGLEKFRLLQPDVVILDLRLPRMDGDKFLLFLRMTPEYRSVPIIVITGISDDAYLEKVERWGVSRLLRKPVSPKELLRATLAVIEGA